MNNFYVLLGGIVLSNTVFGQAVEYRPVPIPTTMPIADFITSAPVSPERGTLNGFHVKGSRLWWPYHLSDTPDDFDLAVTVHWWREVPSLPVDQSIFIVTGTVSDSKAYLSTDTSTVYSEFTIDIDTTLKDGTANEAAQTGGQVRLERSGGAVRFPSGLVKPYYSMHGLGFPAVGRKYLFFAAIDEPSGLFRLLTAYEIRGGNVFALDGQNAWPGLVGAKLPYNAFDGWGAERFIASVSEALAGK